MKSLKQVQRSMGWLLLLFLFLEPQAWSASARLTLYVTYELKDVPLTTEKIWEVDPKIKNAHHRTWALRHHAILFALKAVPSQRGGFGVLAREVRSTAMGYVRGAGPWYQSWEQFDCRGKLNSWFAQPAGAERALSFSADLWAKLLREKLSELETLFSQIRTSSEAQALDRGEVVFKDWLNGVETTWNQQSNRLARAEEWKYYLETARSSGFCQAAKPVAPIEPPSPSSMMEPVVGSPPAFPALLARAPARLWNGLFSIRTTVGIAGRNLNGRFLVDSSAQTSQISPEWLEAQGIQPALIYASKSSVEPVQRSGIWQSTRRLARRVRVDRVEVSGLSLPLREFLLAETQFFNPPETVGSCCDGVLGLDFLRLYPMEFRGSSPPEIQIWPREGFRGVEGAEWTEISELSSGELASSCSLVLSGESSPSSSDLKLEGVSWDLASEKGLQIHTPWRSQWEPILSSKKRSGTTQMVCDGRVMATKMTPSWAEAPGGPSDEGLLTEKEPAMSLGQGLLAQGRFTLDLPHGRIWFAPGTLPLREKLKNTSGLSLTYALEDRERVLRVQSVAAQSPASGLLREGLKSGTVITQVDSRPAEEMDQWEVNQRLAGVYGSQVTLQWETKKGLKLSVLRLNARGSGSASK